MFTSKKFIFKITHFGCSAGVFLGSSSSESLLLSSELDFSTFFAGVSAFLAGAGVVFVTEALGVVSSSLLDSSELESSLKIFSIISIIYLVLPSTFYRYENEESVYFKFLTYHLIETIEKIVLLICHFM